MLMIVMYPLMYHYIKSSLLVCSHINGHKDWRLNIERGRSRVVAVHSCRWHHNTWNLRINDNREVGLCRSRRELGRWMLSLYHANSGQIGSRCVVCVLAFFLMITTQTTVNTTHNTTASTESRMSHQKLFTVVGWFGLGWYPEAYTVDHAEEATPVDHEPLVTEPVEAEPVDHEPEEPQPVPGVDVVDQAGAGFGVLYGQ